jgi:predicted enzyme related to lactoylglutathione lyase
MTSTEATNTKSNNPVTWFEVGTDDPAGARAFYGEAFGWTFDIEGPYSIITTGEGHPIQGGIQDTSVELPVGTPRFYAVPYVQVNDVAVACRNVDERGGKVMVPATTIPTGLVYAHVTDPAGNHFGLFCPPAQP